MLVNDLAQVLRNAGCSVTEVGGWQTHNHGQLSSVQTIVVHHTAGAATGDYPSLGVVRNGRTGLPGPLAQLGVGRSGHVYVISSGLTFHAGTVLHPSYANQNSIGLEVESVGTGTPWPAVQVQATARAVAALCKKFGLSASRVLGHAEICSPAGRKVDPVGIPGGMPAFRQLVHQYITGGFLMALSDQEQEWLYAAIGDCYSTSQSLSGSGVSLGTAVARLYHWLSTAPQASRTGLLSNAIQSTNAQMFYDQTSTPQDTSPTYSKALTEQTSDALDDLASVKSELAAVKSLLQSLVDQHTPSA